MNIEDRYTPKTEHEMDRVCQKAVEENLFERPVIKAEIEARFNSRKVETAHARQ